MLEEENGLAEAAEAGELVVDAVGTMTLLRGVLIAYEYCCWFVEERGDIARRAAALATNPYCCLLMLLVAKRREREGECLVAGVRSPFNVKE